MRRVIILGGTSRDFHNFNVFFADNHEHQVVVFTAAQCLIASGYYLVVTPGNGPPVGAQRAGVMHFRQAGNGLYLPMAQLTMLLI